MVQEGEIFPVEENHSDNEVSTMNSDGLGTQRFKTATPMALAISAP